MSLKFFDKLPQNFIALNDKDDYNVMVEIENKEKLFTTHSNSNISARIFNAILQYIYGGIVNLKNYETRFIYDLMLAVDEFELEELTNKLEILFLKIFIVKYSNLIFDADDFISLEESALLSLLKRDDLQIKLSTSGRTKESFSTIISEEISTWIDRKTTEYTSTNIPYKFELILLGIRDGFAP
ncbi:hypothetical protein Glove_692g27 [Diversispora epigaea]|uniref:BTB domain-containing protein n=1 Tax=Diversispora epigaea TaxID=1348612 RepID=A0A397G5F9_9GLOM|nr:hypothetical protein Glove_692g27 [Diversispora epigaea]